MAPTLPTLPTLPSLSTASRMSPQFISAGGGGGGGTGVDTTIPPIGGGGSGTPGVISGAQTGRFGTTASAGVDCNNPFNYMTYPSCWTGGQNPITAIAGGLPWGRLAAFLLGLILILMGIYLIKPVQQLVTTTVKTAGKTAAKAAAEGGE